MGHLKLTNLQRLQSVELDSKQPTRDYQILLNNIQKYLSDVEIYQFETRDIKEQCPDSAIPYIIMGRTIVGDWFGAMIMDELESEVYTGTSYHFGRDTGISIVTEMNEALTKDDAAMTKAEYLNLISAVEEVGADIKQLPWSLAEDRDIMLHKLLLAADILTIRGVEYCNYITQEDIDEEKDLEEEEKLKQEKREAFAQSVRNNLSNIQVYFIGVIEIDLYLIGQTKNQDWLGIHTEVVWL